MKQDYKLDVFLHSSTSLPKIEKHVRKNANLYKSTDWKEANNLLGTDYNIYILHKETKDSDTLGKLIRQRNPGALIVLATNEPVVSQDTLDKCHADYSLPEDPTRAELLSIIPSYKKLREVAGGQDPGHVADVIQIHAEPSAIILEDRGGSAVALEQKVETEALETEQIEIEPVSAQAHEPAAAAEPELRRSIAAAVAAFFTRLIRRPQYTKVKEDTGRSVLEDKDAASAVTGSRSRLIGWASIALVILLVLGLGIFAQGSHKVKKKATAHKVTNTSQPRNSAPTTTASQPSEAAPAPPAAVSPTAAAGDNSTSSHTPAPAPTPPAAPVNHTPSVSISGPTRVTVGQTVTYHANASDPDGDSLSYSWGGPSKSTAFQNTGTFPVSVTVTDSGGLSASSTIMVTVMQ